MCVTKYDVTWSQYDVTWLLRSVFIYNLTIMSISPFMLHTFMVYQIASRNTINICQNIRIQGLSQTTNPILLYTMTISSIQTPNFRFSQSTFFYPEIAPDCEFWSRFVAKYQFYRKTYAADVNFFIAHQTATWLSDKKVNIRYYFGSRLLVRLYYAFLLHKKIRLLWVTRN